MTGTGSGGPKWWLGLGVLALVVMVWWLVPIHWLPYALRNERARTQEAYDCAHGYMADCLMQRYGWPEMAAITTTLEELRKQQHRD
jgi:hypothetical protein